MKETSHKHRTKTYQSRKLKNSFMMSCAAILLALAVAACEQEDDGEQYQQGQDPAGQEQTQTTPTDKANANRPLSTKRKGTKLNEHQRAKLSHGQKMGIGSKDSAQPSVSHPTEQQDTAGRPPSAEFEELDTDADGQISVEEAKVSPHLSTSYRKLDTDGDSQVSKSEFSLP
jgi:hypothetical protein